MQAEQVAQAARGIQLMNVRARRRQLLVQIVQQRDELAPAQVLLVGGVEEMVEDEPEIRVSGMTRDLAQHRYQIGIDLTGCDRQALPVVNIG